MSANNSNGLGVNGAPASRPARWYELVFREGRRRVLSWRIRNEGVRVGDEGLRWTTDGVDRQRPYADIVAIRLQTASLPRSGSFGQCIITFRDGLVLTVMSVNSWGTPAEDRAEAYADFVHDLHGRLTDADRSRIAFDAGDQPGHRAFGLFAVILAVAFFGVLPVVLLLIIREWEVLWVALGSLLFIWPMVRTFHRNEPRSYDPRHLDGDLFP